MKLSISLLADGVTTLDEYARATGLRSRSAAVRHAIRLLRHPDLEADYALAWGEWEESGERSAWETLLPAAASGLNTDPRPDL